MNYLAIANHMILEEKTSTLKLGIYIYLLSRRSYLEIPFFVTVPDICDFLNYQPNNHKGRINEQIINVLTEAVDKNLITINCEKISHCAPFKVHIISEQFLHPSNNYTIFPVDVLQKIESIRNSKTADLLSVYLAIKQPMGKKDYSYRTVKDLTTICGFGSENKTLSIINQLEKNKIITINKNKINNTYQLI